MKEKHHGIFLRVTPEEKKRAQLLAGQCGLSLTALLRLCLAQTGVEPVVGWRPVKSVTTTQIT